MNIPLELLKEKVINAIWPIIQLDLSSNTNLGCFIHEPFTYSSENLRNEGLLNCAWASSLPPGLSNADGHFNFNWIHMTSDLMGQEKSCCICPPQFIKLKLLCIKCYLFYKTIHFLYFNVNMLVERMNEEVESWRSTVQTRFNTLCVQLLKVQTGNVSS